MRTSKNLTNSFSEELGIPILETENEKGEPGKTHTAR